jgi:hypothetical protein
MSSEFPPTKVSVRLDLKLNLGNFSNTTIDIGVEDYVRPGLDGSAREAIERVYELVDTMLSKKIVELKSSLEKEGLI